MARDVTVQLRVSYDGSGVQQFQQGIQQVANDTRNLEGATRNNSNAFDNLAGTLQTAALGYLSIRGVQMVAHFIEEGDAVRKADAAFTALTGSIGGHTQVMYDLKNATGQVVSEYDLMTGANKLLASGLASNEGELVKLTALGIRLSTAFGKDASEGLENFSLALLNQSLPRLDSFGISAANVRTEMARLLASGEALDRSQAFKLAVMSEGAKTLEKLGDSAASSETPLTRMGTRVKDLKDELEKEVNVTANSVAGFIEKIAFGGSPSEVNANTQLENTAQAQATAYADKWKTALTEAFTGSDLTADILTAVGSAPDAIFKGALKNMAANPAASLTEDLQSAFNNLDMNTAVGWTDEDMQRIAGVTYSMLDQLKTAQDTQKAQQEQAAAIAAQVEQTRLLHQAQTFADNDRALSLDQQRQSIDLAKQYTSATLEYNNAVAQVGWQLMSIGHQQDPMSKMYTGKISASDAQSMLPDFMTQDAASSIADQFRDASTELERLQSLADQKLITDDQLTQAKNMTSNLGTMADAAQKAATAYKNLTLAQTLGQGGGGIAGEVGSMVTGYMQEKGYGSKRVGEMQTTLDLSSGKETAASQELKNRIVPQIAKMTAEKAAIAVANVEAFLQEATLRGMSPEAIAAMMPSVIAGGGKKGQNTFNLAGQMDNFLTGQTMGTSSGSKMFGDVAGNDEGLTGSGKGGGKGNTKLVTTVIADDMARINKDSGGVDKNLQSTTDNLKEASTYADAMKKSMDTMKTVQTLTFKFTADDPSGILGIVKAMMGGSSLADVVKSNGGSVPGQSSAGRATRDRG